jgi:S1-C subfamily serine protease
MKALKSSTRGGIPGIAGTGLRSRVATSIWSVCAAAVFANAAEAHIPHASAVAQYSSTHLVAAAPAMRREPSSRHEPAMLDRLEGAELANSHEPEQLAGVVVVSVHFASAMWRNGLRPDDVIVGVERDRVASLDDLRRALGRVAWPFVLEVTRDGRRIRIVVP